MKCEDMFGIIFTATAIILCIALVMAQPPQTSILYTPDRVRDDFVAQAGQTTFDTRGTIRSNYIEVYRNGLLQRAGATVDYTGAPVGNVYRVTFNAIAGLEAGAFVTLFYYR